MSDFVHLHTHTEYSLLDGAASIPKLIARTKELGMDAIAITDHGNMFGVVDFYREAVNNGIKPIIGCEVYVAPRTRFDKQHEYDSKLSHLVLLAENATGYKNLIKIVSSAYIDGYYYKPRIDFELLSEHKDGLIALSACLAGEIPKALVGGDYDEAKKIAEKYKSLLGADNFFLEIQDHGIEEQKRIIPQLARLAEELGLGLVATNDVHYILREDAEYQDVLMCIQMEKKVNDPDRMKFQTDEFYLKSPDEMRALFPSFDDAIKNTVKIAERCKFDFDFSTRHLPSYDVPDGKTAWDYLRELCYNGLKRKYKSVTPQLTQRLEYELGVIKSMGFIDYFLIVWDFINFAKQNGVMVGPGRGSAAGSIVSYCLDITTIDPMRFSLIFERFLNPERVSMPDIDTDFAPEGRQRVIDYVIEKYGKDKVAQIITFGTMKAKLAVRDVARALDIPYGEADRVAKLIPFDPKMTLDKALEISNELKALYDNQPHIKRLIDISRALEGLPRHASTHAAGVVITGEPMVEYVPLQMNNDVLTTQFTKDTVEGLGLLKMDFLGLRNLTIIENAISIIEKTRGIKIDLADIDYDIKEVYETISAGNTDGVFQLESGGMKSFMKELRPDSLEDIIAGIALYRPGPMDQIPRYIHNKKHPEDIVYKHPLLENILNVTYGCMVYQEQVLQIVRELAGYSLGKADNLRRVISKKKADAMEIERQSFIYGAKDEDGNVIIEGCIARGIDEAVAISIFDEIRYFANYAFNKSHAAAYAFVAYQTAYLKTLYPTEYMAALISSVEDAAKINEYIINCHDMGIECLPPDINKSFDSFSVEGNSIRFGMSAVKNAGRSFVVKICEERAKNGTYKSFADFVERMVPYQINKRAVEGLIKCGAFDSLGVSRAQLSAVFEYAIDCAAQTQKNNIAGQLSLFDIGDEQDATAFEINYPDIPEFDKNELLKMEKQTIGIYLSGHPTDAFADKIKSVTRLSINDILSASEYDEDMGAYRLNPDSLIKDNDKVTVCGVIAARKNRTTRANAQMAILTLEDRYGAIEVLVFPRQLDRLSHKLNEEEVVALTGTVSIDESEAPKMLCESVLLMDEISARKIYIRLPEKNPEIIRRLSPIAADFPGNTPIILYFADTKQYLNAPKNMYISDNEDALRRLKSIFGNDSVVVRQHNA